MVNNVIDIIINVIIITFVIIITPRTTRARQVLEHLCQALTARGDRRRAGWVLRALERPQARPVTLG